MTTHERRRRRRTLYLVGLLPSLLLLLLSARIVFLLHHEARGLDAYQASSFDPAREHFATNRFLNPIQRWIAPFNEGDAHYGLEEFDGAVKAFEAALEVVPEEHECIVRVNLAVSYEALGDVARDDGEGQAADEAYQNGRSALGPCLELLGVPEADEQLDPDADEELDPEADPDPESDPEADEESDPASDAELDVSQEVERVRAAAVRVEARLTRKLGGPAPDLVPPPADAPPEDDRTREKEREVEKRNDQAHEDRVKHQDEFDQDAEQPPPPPPVPQW